MRNLSDDNLFGGLRVNLLILLFLSSLERLHCISYSAEDLDWYNIVERAEHRENPPPTYQIIHSDDNNSLFDIHAIQPIASAISHPTVELLFYLWNFITPKIATSKPLDEYGHCATNYKALYSLCQIKFTQFKYTEILNEAINQLSLVCYKL